MGRRDIRNPILRDVPRRGGAAADGCDHTEVCQATGLPEPVHIREHYSRPGKLPDDLRAGAENTEGIAAAVTGAAGAEEEPSTVGGADGEAAGEKRRMNMKKFELTENFKMYFGKKLFQIRALIDLECGVKAGELGGYVEKEENLNQSGDAWVFGNARVFGNAWVSGNAEVSKYEDILQITGLGTCNRTTTAFRGTKNGVYVKCGCFYGNVEQFRERVKRTRDGKVQAEYLKFAELIEIYFGGAKEE